MRVKFENARILDIKTGKVTKGVLTTCDGKIEYVGAPKADESVKYDRVINANNNLLMPSFKNAHSHSPMTILRASAENMVLMDWLYKVVFPAEAKLTADDVYWGTKLAIMEMLKSGISATFDMYFYTESAAKAFKEAGFRACFCSAVSGGNTDEELKTALKRLDSEYDKLNSYSPLIKYYAGMHAEYTASDGLLKGISAFVNDAKIPFYTHMSEAVGESEGCVERRGKTPAELFSSLGLWNYGGGVYHAVHVTDHDIKLMRDHNIMVSTNPCCNAKIASGIAPIEKYAANGIRVGIGTDGPASNNSISMFKEMYMMICLQRILTSKPNTLSGLFALQSATIGSSKVMGLSNTETLDAGQDADLIMIDMASPSMQPEADIANNLVYAGGNELIKLTMVNGNILYEDGKFNIGVDENEVYSRVNQIKNRIFA